LVISDPEITVEELTPKGKQRRKKKNKSKYKQINNQTMPNK